MSPSHNFMPFYVLTGFSLWTKLVFMIYYKKIPSFDTKRREFTAKIMADCGKTIFAVGLATFFFEKFSSTVKIILWIICIASVATSIFVYPKENKGA